MPALSVEMGVERPVALLLTPVTPDPTGTGLALRAWAWMLMLAREHEVSVLVVAPEAERRPSVASGPAAEHWGAGDCVDYTRRWRLLAGWLLPCLAGCTRAVVMDWRQLRDAPRLAQAWPAPALRARVARIVAFRLCVSDFASATAARFPRARLELDLDDLESDTRWSLARAELRRGRPLQAWRGAMVAWQYRCLESRLLGDYEQVWLAAPEDVVRLQARLQTRLQTRMRPGPAVGCQPNRLQPPMCEPLPTSPPESGEPFRLLFVGALNYLPNVEALDWLLRAVLPRLRRRQPGGWRLVVVGRSADAALAQRLSHWPEIEFLPDVPSLDVVYAQAHLVLVPLHSGGGTKLKTLEAFSRLRPVLATSHGVRGLGVQPGLHCLVADDAAGFVGQILHLWRDPALAHGLSTAARARYAEAFALPR